jgi:hypothetical protein
MAAHDYRSRDLACSSWRLSVLSAASLDTYRRVRRAFAALANPRSMKSVHCPQCRWPNIGMRVNTDGRLAASGHTGPGNGLAGHIGETVTAAPSNHSFAFANANHARPARVDGPQCRRPT